MVFLGQVYTADKCRPCQAVSVSIIDKKNRSACIGVPERCSTIAS